MTIKKAIRKIHLILGLTSGLIVFVLGITGCILAFEWEIRSFTEPYRKVVQEEKAYLPPSALRAIADKNLTSKKALGIDYPS